LVTNYLLDYLCKHPNRPLIALEPSLRRKLLNVRNSNAELIKVVAKQKLLGNKIKDVANAAALSFYWVELVHTPKGGTSSVITARVVKDKKPNPIPKAVVCNYRYNRLCN
jgi:hypothetical protein